MLVHPLSVVPEVRAHQVFAADGQTDGVIRWRTHGSFLPERLLRCRWNGLRRPPQAADRLDRLHAEAAVYPACPTPRRPPSGKAKGLVGDQAVVLEVGRLELRCAGLSRPRSEGYGLSDLRSSLAAQDRSCPLRTRPSRTRRQIAHFEMPSRLESWWTSNISIPSLRDARRRALN
jgi:hypothetical protein